MQFELTDKSLESLNLRSLLRAETAGALCVFEGWVRNENENKNVTSLEYEAQNILCQKEAEQIFQEAKQKFSFINIACFHRVGKLSIGDIAVIVAVAAAHRDEAFKACRYTIDEIKKRLPIWKKEHYSDSVSAWLNCQAPTEHATTLNIAEKIYFEKQIALKEIGLKGQTLLKNSKVLVVGAGGLGTAALQTLVGIGFGTIGICEGDSVEENNISRQVLYTHTDIGKKKIDVATKTLQKHASFISFQKHPFFLNAANVLATIASYDIVLDCTDNFSTKFLLNDACILQHKKFITSSIYQFEGQLFSMDESNACLRCLWPTIPPQNCTDSCAEAGVITGLPAMFGAWQAIEAAKLILNIGKTGNKLTLLNILENTQQAIAVKKNSICSVCSKASPIKTIDPKNYDAPQAQTITFESLEENLANYVFVDIRESDELLEHPIHEIACLHRPLSKISSFAHEWDKQKKYILICAQGKRSAKLATGLNALGFDQIYSLTDGLKALKNLKVAPHG